MVTYGAIIFTLQFLFFMARSAPLPDEENCKWEGRGDPREDRSISLVHLNCKKGFIRWDKPHGGLRILIHPKFVKGDFEVCFTSHFKGVNIYTERGDKLILMQDYKKDNKFLQKCFKSYRGHAVLYIENEKKRNSEVQLQYTTHTEGKQVTRKKTIECQPCNSDQIIESICKSDFVVRGYIKTYIPLSDDITAQANITAKEIISQKRNIFTKDKNTDAYSLGSVKVPSTCSWLKRNSHIHIFTGVVIPGSGPVLGCRIKQKIWNIFSKHPCLKTKKRGSI